MRLRRPYLTVVLVVLAFSGVRVAPLIAAVDWSQCRTESGTSNIASGSTSRVVTLGAAISDTSRAFLLLDSSGPSATTQADDHLVSGFISSSSQLTFERGGTGGQAEISYVVVDCSAIDAFSVQRGQIQLASGQSQNTAAITAVDTARSLVLVSARTTDASNSEDIALATGELSGASAVRAARAGTTSNTWVRFEVMTVSATSAATVQTGEVTLSSGNAAVTDNIPTPVDLARSWLYHSWDATNDGLRQTAVGGQITATNQVTFSRHAASSYTNRVRWYVVEFPASTVSVQRGSEPLDSSNCGSDVACNHDIGITAVGALTKAFSFVTNTCQGTGTAFPRNRWIDRLSSTTNLRTTSWRTDGNNSRNYKYWQIVEFPDSVPTTVLGDGTNPADATVCPGDPATDLDAFTLATTTGTDSVTAVEVTLSAGSAPFLSQLEVVSDDGSTVYGSVASLGGDIVQVTLTTPVGVTTAATQYRVRVTPLSHAAMPAPPGTSHAVAGTVTAVTAGNPVTGSDGASASLTVDNQSPGQAAWGAISPGDGQVSLAWANPTDPDLAGVLILRDSATVTATPVEGTVYTAGQTIGSGTVVFAGTGAAFTDTGLTNGTGYYYAIFARDGCSNYSSGVGTGPHTPRPPVNAVTTLTPSAAATACTRIDVSAPFADDDNGTSTTAVERGPTASGPWMAVCASLTGSSPRICADTPVVESSTYYYRVTFADSDGVNGANPQVAGPVTTPACGVDNTTVVGNSVLVSSCSQLTVTSRFTGDDNGDGSAAVEYNTANSWPGTSACAAATGPSPRQCLVTGLTPGQQYWVRVTFTDPDGVSGPNPEILGPYALPTCGGDTAAPTVLVLTPAEDSVIGGSETVKVQVWDEGGLAGTPFSWYVDAGAPSTAASVNANYSCGADCGVYELALDTTTLVNGAHELTVEVTDAAGNTGRAVRAFTVANVGTKPAGSGQLLRRTHGSQLCLDCHALATHSSQQTGTSYGNWAIDCLTCHTPHRTRNIYLVREQVQTPASGSAAVTFHVDDRSGGTNPQDGYLGDRSGAANAPYGDGICETCHTKTAHHTNSPGGDHAHNADRRCTGCHPHGKGFAAGESTGGVTCASCHPEVWDGMTGGVAKTSRHTLGNVLGTNDSFTDTTVAWTQPLSGTAAADRSCVNMCHQDHIHNTPGATLHQYNVHQDAATQTSRAVGRDGQGFIVSGTPAKTDFDVAAANGGMCVSCHKNAVSTGRPIVDKTVYQAAAHNYTSFGGYGAWTYSLHDGSQFDRNCTKCHADRGDGRPDASANPFGAVHFSDYPKLLAGSVNPNGSAADFVCYNCHGNGTTGQDLSGKDVASQIAKGAVAGQSGHPTDSDAVHDSVAELGSASFGNALGGSGRHVSCLDCHAPHKAKTGAHSAQTNTAGPPLEGAWGAALSSNPSFWAAPAAGNFTKTTIVAGTDTEATLCFKCHSSYYGTLPTSPSGGFTETDTAREFNPANVGNYGGSWSSGETAGSFHPVLASAGANLGATSNIKAPWTRTSLMTCSDCHASNSTADPNGPHGSTAGFLLKGPNTKWDATVGGTTSGMPAGTFCANCHNASFSNSRFSRHTYDKHTTNPPSGGTIKCFNCHSAIPHGTARPGLLVAPAASGSIGGTYVTDQAPYLQLPAGNLGLRINSYPSNNTSGWGENNCGCGNDGWGH